MTTFGAAGPALWAQRPLTAAPTEAEGSLLVHYVGAGTAPDAPPGSWPLTITGGGSMDPTVHIATARGHLMGCSLAPGEAAALGLGAPELYPPLPPREVRPALEGWAAAHPAAARALGKAQRVGLVAHLPEGLALPGGGAPAAGGGALCAAPGCCRPPTWGAGARTHCKAHAPDGAQYLRPPK